MKLARTDHRDNTDVARRFVNKAAKAGRDRELHPDNDYWDERRKQLPHIRLAIAISMLHQYSAFFWPYLTEAELVKLEHIIPQAHFRWFLADDEPDYAGMIQEIIDWCRNPEYEEE